LSYSITTLAVLITAAHFATSPGSMRAISAGVLSAAGMPCQHVRHRGDAGDRGEVLHRVVGAVLDQALVGSVGLVGAEHQHMAVGLGARHRVGADDARAAGAVLDHDRLTEIARAYRSKGWAIRRPDLPAARLAPVGACS
jgi:hypothetical protein